VFSRVHIKQCALNDQKTTPTTTNTTLLGQKWTLIRFSRSWAEASTLRSFKE